MKNPNSKFRCLDIGCGVGSSLDLYEKSGELEITGVDINPNFVEKMRRKYPHANFTVADAHNLPFSKESFDQVYLVHLIEHLENPIEAFKEAVRVCKSGGYLCVIVPHFRFETLLKHRVGGYHGEAMHRNIVGKDELLEVIRGEKLEVITQKQRRWFYGLVLFTWFRLAQWAGWQLEPQTGRVLATKGGERVFSFLRRVADIVDKIPLLNWPNRFLPYEFYLEVRRLGYP